MKIDSIRRAFLWAACDKVTGGKCTVNWEMVCKPKDFGGLGILNLTKFASALRLCWLWHKWNDETKPWSGFGTPCTTQDSELFAAATKVIIGNGRKALFWKHLGLMEDDLRTSHRWFLRSENVKSATSTRHWRTIFGSPKLTPKLVSH
jgi:hypothetical protein